MEAIFKSEDINDGWYFWDETWSDKHGPFDSYDEAERAFNRYVHYLETGEII